MKRKINLAMAAMMLTACFTQGVFANTVIAPASGGVIKGDRMLISVPSGEIFKKLGFDVTLDGDTITLKDSDHTVVLKNGEKSFTTDGKTVTPDIPQQIIDDYYYIPVRAIAESVGATVEWIPETKTAVITYKDKAVTVKRELLYVADAFRQTLDNAPATLSVEGVTCKKSKYYIYDMDKDGVPELIVLYSGKKNDDILTFKDCIVYTYKNGVVQSCGNMGGGSSYYDESKVLRAYDYNGGKGVFLYNGYWGASLVQLDGTKIVKGNKGIDDHNVGTLYAMYDDFDIPVKYETIAGQKVPSESYLEDLLSESFKVLNGYALTDYSGLNNANLRGANMALSVFSVIAEETKANKTTAANGNSQSDMISAYKKIVADAQNSRSGKFAESNFDNMFRYSIYDINKDGVPELIVYKAVDYEGCEDFIYTYKDGAVVSCGTIFGPVSFNEYNGSNAIISTVHPATHFSYYMDGTKIVKEEGFNVDEDAVGGGYIIGGDHAGIEDWKRIFGKEIPGYSLKDMSGFPVAAEEVKPNISANTAVTANASQEDIVSAYKRIIKNAMASYPYEKTSNINSSEVCKYSLYDIDKDGVKELIVIYYPNGQGGKHSSLVYTYKNGAAQECGYINDVMSEGQQGGIRENNGGNGINVSVNQYLGDFNFVTLDGTKLSSDRKAYNMDVLSAEPAYLDEYNSDNLTPIEQLK